MDDIRWFAPNRFCTLPVPRLRDGGLRITTEGDAPARLAFAADGVCAVEAWAYAWRHRVPLVLYLWDLPPWQVYRGGPNPIIPFRGRLVKVPRPWGAYTERNGYFSRQRFVARRAAAVWVPSTGTKVAVKRVFAVAAEPVPFCFDSDRFNRAAGWQEPMGGVPTLLAISRLTAPKNHVAVVRAAAQLPHGVRVHIIGRGPEGATIARVAKKLGVDLKLDEEWQSDRQIVDAYLGSNVVISLSRFEGFGLTPIEAMAMGIPAVASDIEPHREYADRGVALVPLDDDAAAARAIDAALRGDRQIARSYRSSSDLTIEACAARLMPRFEELLRRTH